MAYQNPSNGQFVTARDVVMLPSAARTATVAGDWFDVGDAHTLRLLLDVTAASGTTPTFDVTVQTRKDASDASPRSVGTFTQKTTTGTERKAFCGFDRQARVNVTIGGTTPSFTASITGEMVGGSL